MKTRDIAEAALFEAFRPRNPTVVQPRIEIHQQPNDAADAARLFGELQAKAEAKIIETITVTDNGFECVVQSWMDSMSDRVFWRAIFSVNGHKMTVEHDCFSRDTREHLDMRKQWFALGDKVAKAIADQAIGKAFAAHLRARP